MLLEGESWQMHICDGVIIGGLVLRDKSAP
jgi:hypothetical protein